MTVGHSIAPLSGTAGQLLIGELKSSEWTRFTAVVAFARMSGVGYVEPPLASFTAAGKRADLTVGTDLRSTSYEAAWYLMHAVGAHGRLLLASSEPGATFHPKVFVFSNADASVSDTRAALQTATKALAVVGSTNLTGGGLYVNDEASLVWRPDLNEVTEKKSWTDFVAAIGPWLDPADPVILATASPSVLAAEAQAGRLPKEVALRAIGPRRAQKSGATPKATRRRPPKRPPLVGPSPPPPGPPTTTTPPGLSVLIARLSFGSSRRWPQWELNKDVLDQFFGVTKAGELVNREGVNQAGQILTASTTPLVIATGNLNRRLEFPEPDGRADPQPAAALLVVVDRRPSAFRYAVLLPTDAPYAAIEALNQASPETGQCVPATKRVVVTYADLLGVWPSCPL